MSYRQITLPAFPLNLVLLPGETTKLHIYEERYKQLVEECIQNEASFGIPFTEKGKILPYGSEVRISRILKSYESGSMDILIESKGIFKLLEFTEVLRPKLYGAAKVEILPLPQRVLLPALQDATVQYFGTVQNKLIDYDTVAKLTVFSVATALQLTNTEKYRLIASSNPQMQLLNQINFIIHITHSEQQIKDRFIEN